MREHRPTSSFAFDDVGLWCVRGDFVAPIRELAQSRRGVGRWPVRAAAETDAELEEIQEAFAKAIHRHGLKSKIEWVKTAQAMVRARYRKRLTA